MFVFVLNKTTKNNKKGRRILWEERISFREGKYEREGRGGQLKETPTECTENHKEKHTEQNNHNHKLFCFLLFFCLIEFVKKPKKKHRGKKETNKEEEEWGKAEKSEKEIEREKDRARKC